MQKYYVDCIANTFSQYPVVRTKEKVIARNFKGVMFEEAEQRAKKLAGILNSRPTTGAVDDCPRCGGRGTVRNDGFVWVACPVCSGNRN